MSTAGELKVYWPSLPSRSLGWVAFGAFFVVGLSMVTIGPSQRDGASSVGVGAMVLLFTIWLGAVLATSRLVVTATGVTYCYYLRRKSVTWADILSFGVGESRTRMRWPTLVIRRNDGSILVTNLASFSRTYPARIADELTAFQRQLAPVTTG